MTKRSTDNSRRSKARSGWKSKAESAIDYCVPSEKNVKSPERTGRAIIGVGIGGFSITGTLAATRPLVGVGVTVVLLVVVAYLLVTAKTQKCPVKHVSRKQLDRI